MWYNTSWSCWKICSKVDLTSSEIYPLFVLTISIGSPALVQALVEHDDPFAPFLPLITQATSPEEAIPLLTSTVLTILLAGSAKRNPKGTAASEKALPKLFSYLSTLAKSSDTGLQDIAITAYSSVLRTRRARVIFWENRPATVEPLIAILRTAAGENENGDSSSTLWSGASSRSNNVEGYINGGVGLQLLYHVLLVLWQLSFEGAEIGDELDKYVSLSLPCNAS